MASGSETPTPEPPTQEDPVNPKFNWLKHARRNPFVKARPSLTRESSTAELFSRENSSSDFFQNSRLNLFETAPKPEVNTEGLKQVGLVWLMSFLSVDNRYT